MLDRLEQFQLADAADVAIVAIGIYAILSLLRRSQGALVALGLALLGALYLAARGLGLELVTWVLQGLFATTALVLVVVFQDELRQACEELAAWALGRRADNRPRLDASDILVRSLSRFARRRVGALIVVPGVQKIDRHVQGGVALAGELSEPLLDSLFDPHSDGHDGAIVVVDRRVARFGVQLPLSRNVDQLAGGTRHSAALGLAERCDALCLVVSEERGTVSVARDGELALVPNAQALASLLNEFYRSRRALAAPQPQLTRALRERGPEKLASLALAFVLWLLLSVAGEPLAPAEVEPAAAPLPPVAAARKR